MKEIHNKKVVIGRKNIYSIEALFSFWEDDEGYHAELSIPGIEKPIRVVSNYPDTAKKWLWRKAHEKLDWDASWLDKNYNFKYSIFKCSKEPEYCYEVTTPSSFKDKIKNIFYSELERTGAEWGNTATAYFDHNKPDWYYDRIEDSVNQGFSLDFYRSHFTLEYQGKSLDRYIVHYENDSPYPRFFIWAIQLLRQLPSLPKGPTPEELYEEGLRDIDNMDCPDWLKATLKECLAKPAQYC